MRILFLVLFLLSSKCLTAQVLPFAGLPTRADTLDRSLNHTYIAYCLGKDTLKIRQLNDRLVFPLAQFRRLEKDSTWLPSEEKLAWFDSVQHQMAQNCFSYASNGVSSS
ncbi:MAG TPA: hypothetical protein DCP28_17965 [Cytophagales bacterium]|nr:hypothetical protein [Cytophagales bacterium]